MKFIVVDKGDESVGIMGRVYENIELEDAVDESCLEEWVSGCKEVLAELYGFESKVLVYTKDEWDKLIANEEATYEKDIN